MSRKVNVMALRKRLKLSQTALAERLGVNQTTVHRLETGKMVPSGPVQRLLEQIASQS